jgi:hypothetical protein
MLLYFVLEIGEIFADTAYGMSVNINQESNTITVIPDGSARFISEIETDSVDYRFEFNLPEEQIHEIIETFGTEITNNEITGTNADYIVREYIFPLTESRDGEIYSLFLEVLNR